MNQKVEERITVLTEFRKGSIFPRAFRWKKNTYKIKKVHLSHQEREGSFLNYYFSAECEEGLYQLKFNSQTLMWHLQEYFLD